MKSVALAGLVAVIGFGTAVTSFAEEAVDFSTETNVVSGQIIGLAGDADAYVSPDASSEKKASFAAGDSVYMISENDGWYEIFYKGETLYIPSDAISQDAFASAQAQAQEAAEAAAEELEQQEKQDAATAEAFVRQQRAERNALIWKIVIGILVVAIIAVSIVIAVKGKDDQKTEEAKAEEAKAEEVKTEDSKTEEKKAEENK
ncbi:hypothetical protein [Butyrivibrio sp. AE2032]|uniref:hypothetical protein n=1 Tax=Butyrivibrio sp. AE2032 TaxID=1458463 RepID=UPI000B0C56A9|nr:hypothetical protein [Butyrivibrio sp. AE2032]